MSFEVLEQLEKKIQTAVDTISLLQMELEEVKEEKNKLQEEVNQQRSSREELENRAQQLQHDHSVWQDRIRGLLGKMEDVETM